MNNFTTSLLSSGGHVSVPMLPLEFMANCIHHLSMYVYCKVQEVPNEPGCNLEKVVAGIIFALDETLLTSFGDNEL